MKNPLTEVYHSLLDIFYPQICYCCQEELADRDENTCLQCRLSLPRTGFHKQKVNSFTERFFGRVPLKYGVSYYHYKKGGNVRKLIYQLKYHGKKELGIEIGRAYGYELAAVEDFKEIDLIVPVPLHPKKKVIRGYNQSDMFAIGLSEAMEIPWSPDILQRKVFTNTQTKKDKFDRLGNMDGVFHVPKPKLLDGKHILLVDDVLTTGATLEVCANELTKTKNTTLSMATIAMAS